MVTFLQRLQVSGLVLIQRLDKDPFIRSTSNNTGGVQNTRRRMPHRLKPPQCYKLQIFTVPDSAVGDVPVFGSPGVTFVPTVTLSSPPRSC